MQTAYGESLISAIALQDLLLVVIVFTLAAVVLLALSIEALREKLGPVAAVL